MYNVTIEIRRFSFFFSSEIGLGRSVEIDQELLRKRRYRLAAQKALDLAPYIHRVLYLNHLADLHSDWIQSGYQRWHIEPGCIVGYYEDLLTSPEDVEHLLTPEAYLLITAALDIQEAESL
jgi:hypothetical protein